MCGIVALCYADLNPRLGYEGGELLKRLEYRGYDSTGGALVDDAGQITLLKAVGAPSKVVPALGIDTGAGQRFIGQVRWATYGAVTQDNCQPHQMACRDQRDFVGAHNGNVSNTDSLKLYLADTGHRVVSDNDGEMITHLTEHFHAENLDDPEGVLTEARAALGPIAVPEAALLLIDGARKAEAKARGSYAAAYCHPDTPGIVAVKSGSSLYAGIGADDHGDLIVVSSDLTSVLSKTSTLIPLAEGQGIWFAENDYVIFPLTGPLTFARPEPVRSKLNVRDTGLRDGFSYFMDQEIHSIPDNLDEVIRYYLTDSSGAGEVFDAHPAATGAALERLRALATITDAETLHAAALELLRDDVAVVLRPAGDADADFVSDEKVILAELAQALPEKRQGLSAFDRALVHVKNADVSRRLRSLVADIRGAQGKGGRVFLVASGTSYHAALTAAGFFNGLAGVGVFPVNPGMFRSMYLHSLNPNDLIVAITQSGETKDLVDVLIDADRRTPGIARVALVNNENSRIPQELCDYYLPLLCGPEIAVAATKSFVTQVAILLLIAGSFSRDDDDLLDLLRRARQAVVDTLAEARPALDEAAQQLYLAPSMHILGASMIGVAKEGALKVREVVLNHTEGYDAAEFKHGPNTILGRNTLFSLDDLADLLDAYEASDSPRGREALADHSPLLDDRFSNYPLLFVCPPVERDAQITVSQIHTHKIRGADVLVLAEQHDDLAAAAGGAPAGVTNYWSRYIRLPRTGDEHLFAFTSSVALQYLAFKMSELKMTHLDELGVDDHGVHPDAPKNVSKSITVD